MLPFAALTAVALAVLLVADARGWRPLVWASKPLASAGFVGAALAAGALASPYGRCILAALALAWLGDVLLLPRGARRAFRLGLASFLLGHLAFAAAFLVRGVEPRACALAAALLAAPLAGVLRWLRPHLPAALRAAVPAYAVAISLMLVLAAGTLPQPGGARVLLGASLFYASDLAVARDRFVAGGFANRLAGLPLYYAGQLVLASTVA